MGLEFLLCFLLAIVVTGGRSASDIIHAAKGTTPPRVERARLKAQEPGVKRPSPFAAYWRQMWDDAWSDAKAHHDRSRAEKLAGDRPNLATRLRRLRDLIVRGQIRLPHERQPGEPWIQPPPAPDPAPRQPPPAQPAPGPDDAARASDPLNLSGRLDEEAKAPGPTPADTSPAPEPTSNGGTPMTTATGEVTTYEQHKAELAAQRQDFQEALDLSAATQASVAQAKADLNAQAEHARAMHAAAQNKADSLAAKGLDGETQGHAGTQVDAVDANRLDEQYEALERIEADAQAAAVAAEAGLASVDAEEATIDAKYADAASTVAAELGGDASYLDSGGATSGGSAVAGAPTARGAGQPGDDARHDLARYVTSGIGQGGQAQPGAGNAANQG